MSEMYRLAGRMKKGGAHGVELARVAAVEPLALDIGGVLYSSKDWPMYAPAYALTAAVLDTVLVLQPSVHCAAEGAAVSGMGCEAIAAESLRAQSRWAPGDVVAVQELDGAAFIILCRLEEVR